MGNNVQTNGPIDTHFYKSVKHNKRKSQLLKVQIQNIEMLVDINIVVSV